MHVYQLALFVHLLALLAAFAASAVIHFSLLRMRDAPSSGEALPWLGLCHRMSRVFPVALLVLVASGGWMVHKAWSWDTGFVDAGVAGAALLMVVGIAVEGGRARKIASALVSGASPGVVRDPAFWAANWGSSGLALGVVFEMTTKPDAGVAFAALAAGFAAGAGIGLALRRRPLSRLATARS